MTYTEALAYLETLVNYERTHDPQAMRQVTLERMRRLCERLGHPQQRYRTILVSGTNAKGSICAMIYEILRSAGTRAGLYTSPHLEDVRERIRATTAGSGRQADWISPEEFAEVVASLQPAIDICAQDPALGPPTYFEALTAAAFLYFARQRLETAVLEVGLGGRLDATNVAEPAVSILGPVGLDHTDVLGPDEASIAREKAGILRPSGTVVCAWQPPDAAAAIREAAQSQRCRLIEYDAHILATIHRYSAEGLELTVQGVRGEYGGIRLPLLGRHQAENAAIAVSAVEALTDRGAPRTAVRRGLARVGWPGRLEVISRDPWIILDGGHNPQAARALRATVEELWPDQPKHLVIGMSSDKPLAAVAEILGPMAATITCTSSSHPRAYPPEALASGFRQCGCAAQVIEDPLDACTCAMNAAGPGDVVIVAGSLFLVSRVRSGLSARGSRRNSRPGHDQRMEVGSCQ